MDDCFHCHHPRSDHYESGMVRLLGCAGSRFGVGGLECGCRTYTSTAIVAQAMQRCMTCNHPRLDHMQARCEVCDCRGTFN